MPNYDGTLTLIELGSVIKRTQMALAEMPNDHPDKPWLQLQLEALYAEFDLHEMVRQRDGS